MIPWLTVVIPTIGRNTLALTLESLASQAESAGLEVLVVADTHGGYTQGLHNAKLCVESAGYRWLEHDAGLHCVGQPQRTYGAKQATAPWVWFSQDDNVAAQDALATIELAIDAQPRPRPLFFRWLAPWRETIWRDSHLVMGNIDADCLVFPRQIAHQVEWGLRYEGDFDAAMRALAISGGDVAWIDEVVSIARPSTDLMWWNR